jgi:hypothetical protein
MKIMMQTMHVMMQWLHGENAAPIADVFGTWRVAGSRQLLSQDVQQLTASHNVSDATPMSENRAQSQVTASVPG